MWTYAADSFLPHAVVREKGAETQPVVITREADNPNGAALRLFVEGAEVVVDPAAGYERVILVFDGANEAELDAARRQWSGLKSVDVQLAYWRQTDEGRWERQA